MQQNESRTVKDGFSMLMKFGSRRNLEKLQKGCVYMKNLQYYVDLEKSSDDGDVGDMYDGLLPLNDAKVSLFSNDTNELLAQLQCPVATINLGYNKCPVFCMFKFDYRNCTSESLSSDIATIRFDFSDEQRTKIKEKFGDSVLLITNGDEFIARMKKGFLDAGISYCRDSVQYYDGNIRQHIEDVKKDAMRIAFWKRQKYNYQQEYRFVAFDSAVDDHLCFNIGDISDITRLESTEIILNTYFEAQYKVLLQK